jgi:hypothetical protein
MLQVSRVDHVATQFAVEHHHDRAFAAGNTADEPVAYER